MLSEQFIEQILTTLPARRIGVLGDLFLDRYLDLDAGADRAVRRDRARRLSGGSRPVVPGGVGTVINNLAALGVGEIRPVAFYGDDGEGYELQQALAECRRCETGRAASSPPQPPHADVHEADARPDRRRPRELNRLDIKNRTPTPAAIEEDPHELLEIALGRGGRPDRPGPGERAGLRGR